MNNKNRQPLLLIEDSDEDFEAFERMLKKFIVSNPIYRCTDGDDALDFLYHTGKYDNSVKVTNPAIIILDLNLPGTEGREILEKLKQDSNLKIIPVVVLTTSSNPKDIDICYTYGANSYIIKPVNIQKLAQIFESILNYWLDIVSLPS